MQNEFEMLDERLEMEVMAGDGVTASEALDCECTSKCSPD